MVLFNKYIFKFLVLFAVFLLPCANFAHNKLNNNYLIKLQNKIDTLINNPNIKNKQAFETDISQNLKHFSNNWPEYNWLNAYKLLIISEFYYKNDNNQTIYLDSILFYANESKNAELLIFTLEKRFTYYESKNNFVLQLSTLIEQKNALAHYAIKLTPLQQSSYYKRLAKFYYFDNDFIEALKYYYRAFYILNKQKSKTKADYDNLQNTLSNIGLCYQKLNKLKKAEYYMQSAIKYGQNSSKPNKLNGVNKCNLANIKYLLGDTLTAIKLYQEGLLYTTKPANNELSHAVISISQLIPLLTNKGLIKEALAYEKIGDNLKNNYTVYNLDGRFLESKAILANAIGNYKEAYLYAKRSSYIKDSILNLRIQNSANKRILNNELAEKIKEYNNLQLDYNQAKFREFVFIVSSGVALLILIIILIVVYKFKQHNKRLQKLNAALEKFKNELINANNQLTALNNQKSYLVQTVAHDLRNPIGNMVALTNLIDIDSENLTPEQLEIVNYLKISGKNSISIIEDIMDLSSIERNIITLDKSICKIKDIVKDAINVTIYRANVKNITLHNKVADDILANLDRERISRLLQNLITNAIKFSKNGSVIEIKTTKVDKNFFSLEVSDQGIGIAKEKLKLIFEPYSQASNNGTDGEKSVGLGLSISKKIVELHGGTISVISEPNQGSKFLVIIPINL